MRSALILNGFTRNSLAITRSLGRQGYRVALFSKFEYSDYEDGLNSKYASKYVDAIHLYKNEAKLQTLVQVLIENKFDYLFAGGTADSLFMAKHQEELRPYVKLATESYSKVLRVHDKENAAKELETIGIPVPRSFKVDSIETLKLKLPEFHPPYILKFPDSYASKGLAVYNGAREDLYEFFKENYSDELLPMIQQRVSGELYDTACFAQNGEPIGILCQQRILTAWISGGGGIINTTIKNKQLIAYTEKILNHFAWNGHLEIDWIYNKEMDEFYFLEMNPKYWGTTQLTIDAGYDFPKWSINLLDGEALVPLETYTVGMTFRWIEDELATLIWNRYSWSRGFQLWTMFILRFFDPKIHSNLYLLKDPKPIIGGLNRVRMNMMDSWKKRLIKAIRS